MKSRKFIKTTMLEFLKESRKSIDKNTLPTYLYHVTTNYNRVIESGVLLAKSGLDSGGLGGTESTGVSFVASSEIADNICAELTLLNNVNNSASEEEVLEVLNNIEDSERREFVLSEYHRTISVYKDYHVAALMALRLSRNSLKFANKPFHGLIIFHEEKIKNKDIGVIKISTSSIPDDVEIIEGVDKHLGEVRVLGNVYL